MIESIAGRLSGQDYPLLFVEHNGIEWELEVSATSFRELVAGAGDATVRVYCHLHVREDLMRLYGFATRGERSAFRRLLSVSGLGPRQSLKILSGSSASQIEQMIESEDLTALSRLPGIGKKTAQKIILQLRGTLAAAAPTQESSDAAGPDGALLVALVDMGFDRVRAAAVLQQVRGDNPEAPEHEVFRQAIVQLSPGVER